MIPSITATLAVLLLAGCGDKGNDTAGTTTGTTTGACSAELVGEGLPTALYSVWGSSASNVWTVGADAGSGPLVLHWDGTAWAQVAIPSAGDLWWVWGDSPDSLWFAGEGGRVIHYIPSTGAMDEVVATDTELVLFGLWGSSASDIWAVGGAVDGSGRGVVSRFDGAQWTTQTDIPAEASDGQIFKVWGSGPSKVWMVGVDALIMWTDGAGNWTVIDPPIYAGIDLFTVSGCDAEVVAVGGYGNAGIARTEDGAAFADDSPEPMALAPGFNGVSVHCTHGTVAVGNSGGIWRRTTEWAPICDVPLTVFDYHGVWVDPDGGVWAVGGNLTSQTDGIVAYDGPATLPTISL